MKKRTNLSLTGGIIQIVAGACLVLIALLNLLISVKINNNLDSYNWEMLIIYVCLLFFGIFATIGNFKRDLITSGILNLFAIGYMLFKIIFEMEIVEGIVVILFFGMEMILILVATIFFFCASKSEYEIVFYKKLKEYKELIPFEYKKFQKLVMLVSLVSVVMLLLTSFLPIQILLTICAVLIYVTSTNIIIKQNTTEFKLTTSVIIGYLSLIIMIIIMCIMSVTTMPTKLMSGLIGVIISICLILIAPKMHNEIQVKRQISLEECYKNKNQL